MVQYQTLHSALDDPLKCQSNATSPEEKGALWLAYFLCLHTV